MRLSFLCLFLLLSFKTFGLTHEVSSMDEMRPFLQNADKDTLVVFDIDMVLIQPQEPAFQMQNMKRHSLLAKKIIHSIPPLKRELFFSLMTLNSETVLIDEKMPTFLNELKEKGIPTMALTAALTGKLGKVESMESWKIDRLAQVGLDLSSNAPHANKIVFSDLPRYRGHDPLYMDGILFVNGSLTSKGEAFVKFLELTQLSPKKILFMDDREEHIKSMEEHIGRLNQKIELRTFLYSGAKNFQSSPLSEEEFESKWGQLAQMIEKVD